MEPEILWSEGIIQEDTKKVVKHFIHHYIHENMKPAPRSFYELHLVNLEIEFNIYDSSKFDENVFERQVKEVADWLGISAENFRSMLPSPDMNFWGIWPSFEAYIVSIAGSDTENDHLLLGISGIYPVDGEKVKYDIGDLISFYRDDGKRCMKFVVDYNSLYPLKFKDDIKKENIAVENHFSGSHVNRLYIPQNGGYVEYF